MKNHGNFGKYGHFQAVSLLGHTLYTMKNMKVKVLVLFHL